jgi:hypothetical protein
MDSYKIRINGSVRSVESSDPDKPLLYVLRGSILPNDDSELGGQAGSDARRVGVDIAAPDPSRLYKRAGAAMRLLHERYDHECGRAPR